MKYYDVTIEVGEDPNVKIFRAHRIILSYRSQYLRRTLASKKANKDNVLVHIIKFNKYIIGFRELFQIILKFICNKFHNLRLSDILIRNSNVYNIDNDVCSTYDFLVYHPKIFYKVKILTLLKSHLDPNGVNILPPRNIRIESIIDIKIVNLEITSTISKWIDKIVIIINSKFDHLRELYLPYKFQLLLRGSRDGFTTKKFHELCDGKNNNITFIKVSGTEEILGGNNPLKCYIVNTDNALFYNRHHGPNFGRDTITICSQNDEFTIVIVESIIMKK
ncbi:uncharacterized protein OCT59_025428 [Rhizophagus irregularis]|uniref:uncharacterized protein n=1 Tax=Rhizophagus irregularis TaxID=588596 RepID=UPI0033223CD6|nr:hypothetical protein OCT59_025428 [Rhizophagus irregularis]